MTTNTRKIIYGTDTGSIEDYAQCVVLLVSDDAAYDELLEGRDPADLEGIEAQTLVTWEDTVDALLLAMRAEGIDTPTQARIIATVRDAIDNND
jgi:hypothetical protein